MKQLLGIRVEIWGLLLLWLLLNLVQAAFTGLDPDEAYYWVYARQLDWGYFDHPPMVALLIRIGHKLFGGTLGVRILTALLQLPAFYLLWRTAGAPDKLRQQALLLLLLAAMPLWQVYGFIATPDGPLFLFTVLYLFLFQRFLRKHTLLNTLLLGLGMALLLYSKYHGVLLIFFALLAQPRQFRNPAFYGASAFGFILFLPHLYWQYLHDFPSFRYHLQGRDDPYELKHTLNYLLNQLLIFSPLLFPLLVRALTTRLREVPMATTCKWVIWGFWGFFLYTTSKGHAEPQWTGLLSIPFVLLAYHSAQVRPDRYARWLWRMGTATIVLLLVARAALLTNAFQLFDAFDKRAWVSELRAEAAGRPLLFRDSYRDPSKYYFYTGERTYSVSSVYYRKNQYDLWNWDRNLHGQDILMVCPQEWAHPQAYRYTMTRKERRLLPVSDYQVSHAVTLQWLSPKDTLRKDLPFRLSLHNPYAHDIDAQRSAWPLWLELLFYQDGALRSSAPLRADRLPRTWPAGEALEIEAVWEKPGNLPYGSYQLYLGIRESSLPPCIRSRSWEVEFVE